MSSRSPVRRSSPAAHFLTALLAIAPVRSALAGEPTAPTATPTAQPAAPPSAGAPTPDSKLEESKGPPPPPATPKPSDPKGEALPFDLPPREKARPAPLVTGEPKPLSWDRLLDIGGDFAIVERPASVDASGKGSLVRYEPATGFALHIRWPLHTYLMLEGYFVDAHMPLTIPVGALGVADPITAPPVETYVFGVRLSPTVQYGAWRGFLSVGAGWGRFEFQRMKATSADGAYTIRERGGSFVEIPFGIGVSWEVVKRWLSIDLVGTAAFVAAQHGDAFEVGQTVDAAGHLHPVNGFPVMDASLVQTIGFSLLL